jgi:hypothetical protein
MLTGPFWKIFPCNRVALGFLSRFLPFASKNPDGLEEVAESLAVEVHEPLWRGLMFDYSVEVFANTYVSTPLAGVFGTVLVLVHSLILGYAITRMKRYTQKSC